MGNGHGQTFRSKFHSFYYIFFSFFRINEYDDIPIQVNRIESVQIIESNEISILFFFLQIFTENETKYFGILSLKKQFQ